MKINFDAPINNLKGEAIKVSTNKDAEDTTLGDVAINALFTMTEDDRKLDGTKKFNLYALATIIKQGGEIELKSEDIVLLKERIGRLNGPLIVGRAYELLEPEGKDGKKQ